MEIYKPDPNDNLFLQSRARQMVSRPNEMPWPDPSEKDVVYIAWSNYTKGFAAGFEAGKASLTNQIQALEAELAAMKAGNGN